ncbi:putative lipid II flippase FtsW [Iamia majanohamensis]|uniref:Probable peptidoglycan glycosyltransferase FtsW n=1 Tax=Iamia majanohamensis TaxID=467976 RepID=A0AAE9YA53_9ACTN|nr:putative lipid II flippase FtsW [Iamia majanohamensis]WCO65222.1 putative lipid II flippase FtsW [Iamia majanohamensis]
MTTVSPLHPRRETAPEPRSRRLRLALPGPPPGEPTGTFTVLAAVVAVLVLFGLVMVLSSSSIIALEETGSTWGYGVRQAIWAVVGLAGLLVALYSDRRQWRRWCRVGLVGVVVLLLAVLAVGQSANGATRWIGVGPLTLQPSELAKVALVLFVADLLARRCREMDDPRRTLWPVVGVLGGVLLLVLVQPNLGTSLVITAIVLMMLFAAGARMRALAGLGGLAVLAAGLLVWFEPYRRRRLFAMFDPWSNKSDSGYQAIQAGVGLSDGGLTGLGLGQSKAKYGYLPFSHNDFIFAIIGEELGLLGALAVVLLFVMLTFLGVRAASHAADRFSALVAVGITTWLVGQAFLNVAVVLGLVPNTGVPLPFVSYGGSSLLVTMVGVGMLLNIARHPRPTAPDLS